MSALTKGFRILDAVTTKDLGATFSEIVDASGVSKATIPTMPAMVGALSGVFAITWLNRKAGREVELLEDHLTMDH